MDLKWKYTAPRVSPARSAIFVTLAPANPHSPKTSAPARMRAARVRTALSCFTVRVTYARSLKVGLDKKKSILYFIALR
ncbi:protein of unknown function [Streptomyces sp. KY75]|nr:protein of unknown function [Streptomyces sp. KY75]